MFLENIHAVHMTIFSGLPHQRRMGSPGKINNMCHAANLSSHANLATNFHVEFRTSELQKSVMIITVLKSYQIQRNCERTFHRLIRNEGGEANMKDSLGWNTGKFAWLKYLFTNVCNLELGAQSNPSYTIVGTITLCPGSAIPCLHIQKHSFNRKEVHH